MPVRKQDSQSYIKPELALLGQLSLWLYLPMYLWLEQGLSPIMGASFGKELHCSIHNMHDITIDTHVPNSLESKCAQYNIILYRPLSKVYCQVPVTVLYPESMGHPHSDVHLPVVTMTVRL